MPLFEFRCVKCDVEFEKLVRSSSAIDQVICPMCGSREVEQQLSGFASPARSGSSTAMSSGCKPSGG
jgi:putative FmdB family regulatory protein